MRKTLASAVMLILSITALAQNPVAPEAEYVMRLHVTLGAPYSVGETPRGQRVVIPITGGTFEGRLLRGTIVSGGADYQLVSGNRTELEAIYSILTDDSVYIHVRNRGIIYNGPDENGRLSSYFKSAPVFEAPADSRYAWLNNAIFICSPAPSESGSINLDIWKVVSSVSPLLEDSLLLQSALREEVQINLPLFQTKYTADPSPLVVGDTLFLYTSHDASPEDIPDPDEQSSAGFFMYDWLLWSTTDMANWTEHGAVASLKDFPWRSRENGAWAIQTVERNGKYYLYAPLHGHGIGVLVSDSPYGPFHDPLGVPLVWDQSNWYDIDPSVYVDDDGQAYMYWGNPYTFYARLNDDMISLKDSVVQLPYYIDNYQEGPWFYKRDGHYYLSFASTCCPEALGYAMSDSPTGPWQWKNYIMRPTERDRGNLPGIVDYKGHSYVFGQNYDLMHLETFVHHERRSVSAQEIHYRPDGTIEEIPYWLDQEPLKQLHWLNPYQRVEAETMAWGYGLKTAKMGIPNTGVVADMPESTGKRNMYVYDIDDGEYIKLRGVDFGTDGARQFAITAAALGRCTITLRLDSQDGPTIGTVNISSTGSTESYRHFTTKVKGATGIHDLYLCFSNASGDVRLDWWQFKKQSNRQDKNQL